MSTAMLNVWITEIGDPCHIIKPHPEDPEGWFVHVLDCDGNVLQWCKTTYRDIPAPCGHAEIEVPPGCYSVLASHTRGAGTAPDGTPVFGNRLTHVAVVRVNCGDHACVTLFSPSIWHCGTWFRTAIRDHTDVLVKAGMKAETARGAVAAVDAFLKQVKIDPFTANMEALQQGPKTK
jgi:hypothetical protein